MFEVRLHLRVLVPPNVVTLGDLVGSSKAVFEQADVVINVKSTINLNLSNKEALRFSGVKVHDSCTSSRGLTAEQKDLFALAATIDAREVVVFFVQDTVKALEGCAQHPDDIHGAIVTSICSKWTLAHELGHLLGLSHVTDRSQLMFNRGTIGITKKLPLLDKDEIEIIQDNRNQLLHKA